MFCGVLQLSAEFQNQKKNNKASLRKHSVVVINCENVNST